MVVMVEVAHECCIVSRRLNGPPVMVAKMTRLRSSWIQLSPGEVTCAANLGWAQRTKGFMVQATHAFGTDPKLCLQLRSPCAVMGSVTRGC